MTIAFLCIIFAIANDIEQREINNDIEKKEED